VLSNALVHAYAKCGDIDDAREVFDRIEERNVTTWNTMIGGLAQHGCGREAYELFLQMQREDQPGISCVPDATTYVSILNPSCASEEGLGTLEWVKKVYRNFREASGYLELDLRVGNALVYMYAKSGSIDDVREVIDRMEESRDIITWTVTMGAYAESGCGGEAYALLLRMKREEKHLLPDSVQKGKDSQLAQFCWEVSLSLPW
jgi:pentatricopeptide repeat protein